MLLLLAASILEKNLSRTWLMRILERREKELYEGGFSTIEELEDQGEKIHSSLLYLSLESLGIRNLDADHVASHIGKATTIAIRLRAVPYHASKKLCFLPRDVMARNGASEEKIFRGESDKSIEEVVYKVSSVAHAHLTHAREISHKIPKQAKLAFLPALFVDEFLSKLQKAHFNIFDPSLSQSNRGISLPFRLYWNKYSGKF